MQYFLTALFIKRISSRGNYGEPNFPVVYAGKLTDFMKALVIYTARAWFLWCIHIMKINKTYLNFQLTTYCGTISMKNIEHWALRQKKLNFVSWYFYSIDPCILTDKCSGVSGFFLLLFQSHSWKRNPPMAVKNQTLSLVQKASEMTICGC